MGEWHDRQEFFEENFGANLSPVFMALRRPGGGVRSCFGVNRQLILVLGPHDSHFGEPWYGVVKRECEQSKIAFAVGTEPPYLRLILRAPNLEFELSCRESLYQGGIMSRFLEKAVEKKRIEAHLSNYFKYDCESLHKRIYEIGFFQRQDLKRLLQCLPTFDQMIAFYRNRMTQAYENRYSLDRNRDDLYVPSHQMLESYVNIAKTHNEYFQQHPDVG